MSGEGIIFGPIYFQNTQKGLRYPPGFRPDLEARGSPADFVDLDQGHRETAILPACIRRQLPFVGNVWIFRGLYYTESSKVLLSIKLLQCLKLSCKVLIKKKLKKSVNSIWLPGVPQAGPQFPPFPLTRKRKKGSGFIHRDTLHSATTLTLLYPALQTKLGASCTVWA